MRLAILGSFLMFLLWMSSATSRPASVDQNLPASYVPSGKVIYQLYCSSCHGADAKGDGPLAASMKVRPTNLTMLAKQHDGNFPREYVRRVLQFGSTSHAHGSSEMPAWGPIFQYFDKQSQDAARKRIDNLCDYLSSIQK